MNPDTPAPGQLADRLDALEAAMPGDKREILRAFRLLDTILTQEDVSPRDLRHAAIVTNAVLLELVSDLNRQVRQLRDRLDALAVPDPE